MLSDFYVSSRGFNGRRELLSCCDNSNCVLVVVLLQSSGLVKPLQELLRLKDLGLKQMFGTL